MSTRPDISPGSTQGVPPGGHAEQFHDRGEARVASRAALSTTQAALTAACWGAACWVAVALSVLPPRSEALRAWRTGQLRAGRAAAVAGRTLAAMVFLGLLAGTSALLLALTLVLLLFGAAYLLQGTWPMALLLLGGGAAAYLPALVTGRYVLRQLNQQLPGSITTTLSSAVSTTMAARITTVVPRPSPSTDSSLAQSDRTA
ncbi:hypothetical protein SMC26_18620 [Actinomadura fulvescens]